MAGPSFPRTRRPAVSDPFQVRRAIAFAALAEGVLSLMDALIKLQTARYPIFEITFLRFFFGALVAAVVFALQKPEWPRPDTLKFHLARSVLSVGAATSFFYALSQLPIAEAMALSFVAPLFIAIFGVVLLKERFDSRIGLALIIGIVGMFVIVSGQLGARPYAAGAYKGAIAVVVSAIFYALVMVMLRARANRDPLPTIVLIQNAAPALILAVPAAMVWKTPTSNDLWMFLLIGCLGVGGHTLLANAFMRAEAARLAPIHYLVLVWGTAYGWLFFGDIPGLATPAAASLIVAGTWLTRRV